MTQCFARAAVDERLRCDQETGHAGPHIDPLYGRWRIAYGVHADDTPPPVDQPAPFDPMLTPWKSITIDGVTIPATMFLANGLVLDVQHGKVSLTFRVRESVSVVLLDRSGKAETFGRPNPDDRPDLAGADQ